LLLVLVTCVVLFLDAPCGKARKHKTNNKKKKNMGCCTSAQKEKDRRDDQRSSYMANKPVRGSQHNEAANEHHQASPPPEEQPVAWMYIDLLKVLQGPFSTPQMRLWLDAGYLPDDLEVRLETESHFTPLKYRKHEINPNLQPIRRPEHSVANVAAPPPEPTVSMRRAVALYPYTAQRSDELTMKRGEVFLILQEGRNWWEVTRRGMRGKVPGNYVEVIHPTEKVIAMYDYTPDGVPSCLRFRRGNILEVVEKHGDGWWKGVFEDTLGAFPSSFVQPYEG